MSPNSANLARRRFLLVAVAVPAVVVAVAVALQLIALPSLPDPVAVNWGSNGPDGFAPPWLPLLLTVLLGAGIPALMAGSSLSGLRGDGSGHGSGYRFLGAIIPGITTMLCLMLTWGQLMQSGLPDAALAPGVGLPVLWSLLAGLAVGAVCWLVQPKPAPAPAAAPGKPLPLAEGERAVWFRETSLALPALLLILGAVTAVAAGALIAWLWADPAVAWTLTALTAVLLAAAATTTAYRVRVDERGLTVTSIAGFPRFFIPLDEVRDAEAVAVVPAAEFGGWGLRWVPGRFGVVVRTGPALQVNRRSGRQFVVTVDDAETGAALLQAMAARTA
ncbi:DUF1648 domain-containing protein [Arthrobacter sp. G119Y2]|uniref:DUF1648 domain-containing protein n=1 Tax=Arthrobacter sp. G119Y2 TaxID=3134965 RepID=UPI003119B1A0